MTTTKLSAAPAPLQAARQPSKDDDEPPANPPPTPRPRAAGRRLLLVESLQDAQALAPGAACMSAADFLDAAAPPLPPGTTIVNLCRSYKYLSLGYYCSLLAEARGHRVYPSVKTINDLSRKAAYSHEIDDLDHALNRALGGPDCRPMPSEFAMDIHFGSADFAPLDGLARRIFATFPAPAMRVEFERGGEHGGDWHIRALRVLNVAALEPHRHALFDAALRAFQPDALALPASARRGARTRKRGLQQAGELGVAEGDVRRLALRQLVDDCAQRQQRLVDERALQPVRRRALGLREAGSAWQRDVLRSAWLPWRPSLQHRQCGPAPA